MFRAARFVNSLFLGIVCFLPGYATSEEQIVQAGAWDATLPLYMPRNEQRGENEYKKTVDGPYHTLIFSVFNSGSITWGEAYRRASPAERNIRASEYLSFFLSNMERGIRRSDERNTLVSIDRIPATMLPPESFCGGYNWQAIDSGVPGHVGEAFTMLGYSIVCFDYVETAHELDFVYLGFSERFCSDLDHKPLPNFSELANKLFRTMKYRKGPAHKAAFNALGNTSSVDDLQFAEVIEQLEFNLGRNVKGCQS